MVRFRKSKKVGPFNFTASKSGLSGSVGAGGFRVQLFGGRKTKNDAGGCLAALMAVGLLFVGCLAGVGILLPDDPPVSSLAEPARPIVVPEPEPDAPPVQTEDDLPSVPLIPYRVLSHDTVHREKVSFDVEVDLIDGELPTKDQLGAISNRLVSNLPYKRKFVGFYLPGMVVDSGYFATAHHLPDLEVKINSWALPEPAAPTVETPEPLPDGLYREWASADGRFSTQARLLDYTETAALLMRRNPWKAVTVPIGRLSDSDQQYIESEDQQLLVGEVISIADGDTFRLRDSENHSVRLEGIDAPERKQDYGTKSKDALAEYLFGKKVRVRWTEKDHYGRILGQVISEGQWVNHRMVDDGWAWHFTEYSDDPDLAEAERLAREAKRGLWAGFRPMAPWDYRARPKIVEPEVSDLLVSPERPVMMSHWLNTSSNVRHNRSCKHYNNTKKGRPCSASEGKPCGICGG